MTLPAHGQPMAPRAASWSWSWSWSWSLQGQERATELPSLPSSRLCKKKEVRMILRRFASILTVILSLIVKQSTCTPCMLRFVQERTPCPYCSRHLEIIKLLSLLWLWNCSGTRPWKCTKLHVCASDSCCDASRLAPPCDRHSTCVVNIKWYPLATASATALDLELTPAVRLRGWALGLGLVQAGSL